MLSLCQDNYLILDTAILITADSEDTLQKVINKWCFDNCIVFNPTKSNFLLFNTTIIVKLNGHALENPSCVKYLGILINNIINT